MISYGNMYGMILKYFKQSEEYSRCLALNYFPSRIPTYKNGKAYREGLYFIELVEIGNKKIYNLYCDLKYLSSFAFKADSNDMNEVYVISNELNIMNKTFYLNFCPMIKSELDLSSITFSIRDIYPHYSLLDIDILENLTNLNVNIILSNYFRFNVFKDVNEIHRFFNILSRIDLSNDGSIELSENSFVSYICS